MENKVILLVARVLNQDATNLSVNSSMKNVAQWDSLKQMQIIMAVEDEFKIKVSDESLFNATSVKSLIDLVIAST